MKLGRSLGAKTKDSIKGERVKSRGEREGRFGDKRKRSRESELERPAGRRRYRRYTKDWGRCSGEGKAGPEGGRRGGEPGGRN